MDALRIAAENRTYYRKLLGSEMREKLFAHNVLCGLNELAVYGLMTGGQFVGYVCVDSRDVKRQGCDGDFIDAVAGGMMERVSERVAESVEGELYTDATVEYGIYRFDFKITGYERCELFFYEKVRDPMRLSDLGFLGRFIELKITVMQNLQ